MSIQKTVFFLSKTKLFKSFFFMVAIFLALDFVSVAYAAKTLTLNSLNPSSDVVINYSGSSVAPASGTVTTPGTKSTGNNDTITLTAPATAAGNFFSKWTEGATTKSTNTTFSLPMNNNHHTLVAEYISPFVISAISGNTTEAGGTATFIVRLSKQPTADVNIGVSSSDTTEGTVSPASLTFTSVNWNTDQTVTVTGVNDSIVDGNIAYTIILAAATSADSVYNGLNPDDVSVTNIDDDTLPTAVNLSSFTAEAKRNKVILRWKTETEIDNAGFRILRSESEDGTYVKIKKNLIPAKGNATQGAEYKFIDKNVDFNKIYYYKLEDIDRKGQRNLNGPVSVTVSNKKKK